MVVLPPPRDAVDGMPRGTGSLTEVFKRRIKPHTDAVADKWGATVPALAQANVGLRGQVNHNENWRDPATGYHSNDIESEWGRFKLWFSQRYSYVRSSNNKDDRLKQRKMQHHVDEYVYYVNVGSDIASIMKAFIHYNGCAYPIAGI